MKWILFVLFFCSLNAYSQEDTSRYQRYATTYGMQVPRIWAGKVFRLPDTSRLNALGGALGTNPAKSELWLWNGENWSLIRGGGGGSGTSYTGGLWTNVDGTQIKSDSVAMAAYFLRRKDSGVNYVTPFQLGARIDSVNNNYLPLNGGTMTGKIIGTATNTNLFNPVFTTDTSKPTSAQIVIGDDWVPSFLIQDNADAANYTSYATNAVVSIYNSKTTELAHGGELDYLGLSEVNKPLFKGIRGNRNYSANYDSLTYVQRIYSDKNLDTLYRSGDSLIVFKKNGTRWGIYSPTSTGGGGTGTVSTLSVTTANGISGTVANASTTPAITLNLDATKWQTKAATKTTSDSVVALIPTNNNTLTNGAGYITSSSLSPYKTISSSNADSATLGGELRTKINNTNTVVATKENSLGNPASNGYVLSSTTTGTRSWVAASGGSIDTSYLSGRIDGKNFKLGWINVKDYGAVGDGVTNDATAIQNAINAAKRSGVYNAVVYFPYTGSDYIIGGALKTSDGLGNSVNNAQLYIPFSGYSKPDSMGTIRLLGEVAPNNFSDPNVSTLPRNMVTLRSTNTSDSGAILGSAYNSTDLAYSKALNFTNTYLENLSFRVRSKSGATHVAPKMTAFDATNLGAIDVLNCRFDTESDQVNSVQPATTSIGIKAPPINNFVRVRISNTLIQNFYSGIIATEHAHIENVNIFTCYNGLEFTTGVHNNFVNRALVQWCRNAVYFSGNSNVTISQLDIERTALVKWYASIYDVYEPTLTGSRANIFAHASHDNGILITSTLSPTIDMHDIGANMAEYKVAGTSSGVYLDMIDSATTAKNWQIISSNTRSSLGAGYLTVKNNTNSINALQITPAANILFGAADNGIHKLQVGGSILGTKIKTSAGLDTLLNVPITTPDTVLIISGGGIKKAALNNMNTTLRVTGNVVPASGTGLELGWTGAYSQLVSYDRTNTIYKPFYVFSSMTNISSPLDASGVIRATGNSPNTGVGAGLELQYGSGRGQLLAYDRGTPGYKGITYNGIDHQFFLSNAEKWRIDANGNWTSSGGIGSTSAIMDVSSTSKGVLLPRMTTTQRNLLAIGQIGIVVPTAGTGYTNGTYTSVPLTGGSGTGAIATVTIAGGVVSSVAITTTGSNYLVGNTLSFLASNVGGTGTGGGLTVSTLLTEGLMVMNNTSHTLDIHDGTRWLSTGKYIAVTATLDFPSTATGIAADLTVTLTGAAVGDVVTIGVPNGSMTATGQYFGWVSATNTVTIRYIPHATEDPASGVFNVKVFKD